MADLKISQLTGATTPLAGTEVLPIVQSGSTRQVSVANLTAGRTQTSNGIVQGTAGTGYNFTANTPAAGKTSQLLNWYEEGTWTPVVSGTGTAGTYELAAGTVATYTRIGRQVTINASIVLAAAITGGGTGSLKITGLPFAKASGQQAPGVFGGYSVDFDASVLYASTFFSTIASSSTLLITQYKDNTAYALLPITAIAANSEMYISVTYFA